MPVHRAARGLLLVIAAAVLWGTSGVIAAVLYRRSELSAVDVGFFRLLVAAVALAPVTCRPAQLAPHRRVLVIVGCGLALFQVCYFAAVAVSSVSLATLVTLGFAPILVAAASPVLLGEVPDRRTMACLGLALCGLVLLVGTPAPENGGTVGAGAALAIGSAAGYATVTLVSRATQAALPVLRYTGATFAIGTLALAPIAVAGGVQLPADALSLTLLVTLGLAPTALAYALFFAGLRHTTATAAAITTLLEPTTATLLAVALLGERQTTIGWVGAGLLLASVAVLSIARPTPQR